MNCPALAVPIEVMHHVVRVESSYNPYAIGIAGGRLVRQPENLPEALATVRMLEGQGYNFSLGLAQVNRYNLSKYGLQSYETAFQACPNLQAGSRILAECHRRSGGDWGRSFSCYYSGNFVTGYRHGYVQKIYASMRKSSPAPAELSSIAAIPVIGRPSRRAVVVSRYPSYAERPLEASMALAHVPNATTPGAPSQKSSPTDSTLPARAAVVVGPQVAQPAQALAEATTQAPEDLQAIADEAFVF